MAKRVSIVNNIFFNGSVQVTSILLNILLLPYITRIFDASSLGINSFGQAVAGYFVLFGNLGITIYGARVVAESRDDNDSCQLAFSRCISYQFFFNSIALILYSIWAYYRHNPIYYIFNIMIFTSMTDLSWAYTGKERFDLIAIRNFVIKIIGTTSIFIFIRRSDQLPLFILLQQGILLISNVIYWIELPKIDLKPQFSNIKTALPAIFLPALSVFIPSIFSSIYLSLNKVMLGYMSTINEVAIYDYPNRLVRIAITLIGVIGTVLMPRLAYLRSISNISELKNKVKQMIFVSLLVSVPTCALIGLLAIPLSNVFFSSTLEGSDVVLKWVAPTIITSGLSLYVIYVSLNRMKLLTLSVAIAAVVNIMINIFFIPRFGAMGAALSTLVSEILVHILLLFYIRDVIDIKWVVKRIMGIGIIGIVCSIIVYSISGKLCFGGEIYEIIIVSVIFIITFFLLMSFFYNKDFLLIIQKSKRK